MGQLCTLLGLYRAELIAPPTAIVDEIALSESFLKVLTRLGLEACVLHIRLLPGTGARALGQAAALRFVARVLAAHHQVVRVDLAPLGRLHQLVRLVCCLLTGLCSRVLVDLGFNVIE